MEGLIKGEGGGDRDEAGGKNGQTARTTTNHSPTTQRNALMLAQFPEAAGRKSLFPGGAADKAAVLNMKLLERTTSPPAAVFDLPPPPPPPKGTSEGAGMTRTQRRESMYEGMTREARSLTGSAADDKLIMTPGGGLEFKEAGGERGLGEYLDKATSEPVVTEAPTPAPKIESPPPAIAPIPAEAEATDNPPMSRVKRLSLLYGGTVSPNKGRLSNPNFTVAKDGALAFKPNPVRRASVASRSGSVAILAEEEEEEEAPDRPTSTSRRKSVTLTDFLMPAEHKPTDAYTPTDAYAPTDAYTPTDEELLYLAAPLYGISNLELDGKEDGLVRLKNQLTAATRENAASMNALLCMVYKLNTKPLTKQEVRSSASKVVHETTPSKTMYVPKPAPLPANASVLDQLSAEAPSPRPKSALRRRSSATATNMPDAITREWTSAPPPARVKKGIRSTPVKTAPRTRGQRADAHNTAVINEYMKKDAISTGKELYEREWGASGKYGKSLFLVESMQKAKKEVEKVRRERAKAEALNAVEIGKARRRDRSDSYFHSMDGGGMTPRSTQAAAAMQAADKWYTEDENPHQPHMELTERYNVAHGGYGGKKVGFTPNSAGKVRVGMDPSDYEAFLKWKATQP